MGALQELSPSWALLVEKRQNFPLYQDITRDQTKDLFLVLASLDIRKVNEVETL